MRSLKTLPILILLVGCSQVEMQGEVRPDGGYRRQLTFSPDETSMGAKKSQEWKKRFTFQKTLGWTLKDAKDPNVDTDVVVATREFSPGTTFAGDITVNDSSGKPILTNAGAVVKNDDQTLEYLETFKWLGKREISAAAMSTMRDKVARSMPDGTPAATIDAVVQEIPQAMVEALYGLNDPIADIFLTNRSYSFQKLRRKMKSAVRKHVADDATAERVAAALLDRDAMNADTEVSMTNEGESRPTAFLMSMRFPGEVIETDGRREEDGTITWRFYGEGARFKDLTLRAVCRP